MENLNILSVPGFSFFLLIIVIGYFIVEVVWGERYLFRGIIQRNKNSIFDRFLHYLVWGVIINVCFAYFHYFSGNVGTFLNLFNISGPLAMEIDKQFGGGGLGFQIIFFDIFYFLIFLLLIGIIYIPKYLLKVYVFLRKIFKMHYRKNKKISKKSYKKK